MFDFPGARVTKRAEVSVQFPLFAPKADCTRSRKSETFTQRGGGAAASLRQHRVNIAAQLCNNGRKFAVGKSLRRAIASTLDIALEVLENLLLNYRDSQPQRIKSL